MANFLNLSDGKQVNIDHIPFVINDRVVPGRCRIIMVPGSPIHIENSSAQELRLMIHAAKRGESHPADQLLAAVEEFTSPI